MSKENDKPEDEAEVQSASEQSHEDVVAMPEQEGAPDEQPHDVLDDDVPAAKSGVSKLALVAVALAIIGLGIAAYLHQQQQMLAKSQDRFVPESRVQELSSSVSQVSSSVGIFEQQFEKKLQEFENKQQGPVQAVIALEKEVDTVRRSAQRLSDEFNEVRELAGQNARDWALAEAYYLVTIADHKLRLQRDVPTAYAALGTAERRLRALGDSKLAPVRTKLQADMQALKSAMQYLPDESLIDKYLTEIERLVPQIPIAVPEKRIEQIVEPLDEAALASKPSYERAWLRVKKRFVETMSTVFTVRKDGRPVEPLLPPSQQAFLQQNMDLKLQTARLALAGGKNSLYISSLSTLRQWMNDYLDVEAPEFRQAMRVIDQLSSVDLSPPLPDVSESVRAVRLVLPVSAQKLSVEPIGASESKPEAAQ